MNSPRRPHTAHLKLAAAFAAAFALAGCNMGMSSNAPAPSMPNLTGNWQIQVGPAITSPPTVVSLAGAMQNQGSQVTGTFYTSSVCSAPEVVNYTGMVDSMGNLTLTTPGVNVQLLVPTSATALATGMISAGPLPNDGPVCALLLGPSPAVGAQISSLTGTFTGAVATGVPVSTGTVSAMLTQSATPNASGQFPLAGTITFTSGSCMTTTPVAGTISGLGLTLATSMTTPPPAQTVSVAAYTNPATSQVTATSILFTPSPCSTSASSSSTYTGTLARQ